MRSVVLISLLFALGACSTLGPPVSYRLDENTGATVTHINSPLVLYRDDSARAAHARNFVYIGPLAVNRMGEYHHFLWLGIWSSMYDPGGSEQRDGFESIVLFADGEPMRLELEGWTLSSIGVSQPVYNKPTATAADAYYSVTMDQIRVIAEARDIRLRTGGPRAESFEPWDSLPQATSGFREFVRYVAF